MPVASLSNRFGIGDFGKESYRFVDLTQRAGFTIWQILPLNPLGYGNSPYQPYSSYAMDEIYISLDTLYEEGLLKKKVPSYLKENKTIDYEACRKYKEPYLKEAFRAFKPDRGYETFKKLFWVEDYVIFRAFKEINDLRPWNEWPKEQKNYPLKKDLNLSIYKEDIDYQYFLQYMLYKQWKALKHYANEKGIRIMGDIPFYVGYDSADCWGNRDNFLLDDDGHPDFIAGVPPDYFSADGQRWGNPIYNWDKMKKDHFSFWINRIKGNDSLFDIIRIDHFRAFDTYWKIPSSCPTARIGEWIEAPGYAFFDTLFKEMPKINIVAEDLGDLRAEVLELRDHYHFPGMNILQFTFNPYADHNNEIAKHCVLYTGTHDNDTLRGCISKWDSKQRNIKNRWLRKHGYNGKNIAEKMIDFALRSDAEMVIIPLADWLYLDSHACLNSPGTVGSPNWEWRLPSLKAFENKASEILKKNETCGRYKASAK